LRKCRLTQQDKCILYRTAHTGIHHKPFQIREDKEADGFLTG